MASTSGRAADAVASRREQPLHSATANAGRASDTSRVQHRGGDTSSISSSVEGGKGISSASVGLTSSLPSQKGGSSQDSIVQGKGKENKDRGSSPLVSSRAREQALWQKVESIMAAKQSHVQQVLEEFGIADVPPTSDPLEEQVWRVVQGELTLQQAADLV